MICTNFIRCLICCLIKRLCYVLYNVHTFDFIYEFYIKIEMMQ